MPRNLLRPLSLLILTLPLFAQSTGSVRGKVTLEATGQPLHHANIILLPLGRVTESGDDGQFSFDQVPAGRYSLIASVNGLSGDRQSVDLSAGGQATADFSLKVTPIREQITVTASGRPETAVEAFSSVSSLDTLDLSTKTGTSLGDVLDGQPGVAKRSFGPGNTRPVLRGFDGDRVLIMQDGVRTGTLSSQSGDHGEPVDPQSLERIEIVRGPSTLLYGSNAIGGVVNMITGHHDAQTDGHPGLHGYISTLGSTNNSMLGSSAGVDYGIGRWVLSLNSGGQHASDYSTARGRIDNSGTRNYSGQAGLAYYAPKGWFNFSYNTQRGTYQIPPTEDEVVAIPFIRQNVRLTGGFRSWNKPVEGLQYSLNYSNWHHDEAVSGEVENQFFNKQFDYRTVFEQRRTGRLTGNFGIWGLRRDYKAVGDEAITPPVIQNAFAGYGVETLTFERLRLQFGGRIETNRYNPSNSTPRNFTGFSGSVGANVPLWKGGAFVTNYNHSFRAPALEEIYAYGPHAGNLTFEIGDLNLRGERSNGIDVSLRHTANRVRFESNYFYYRMQDFVYLAPTGEIEDGLIAARYSQADTRYTGIDGRLQAGLHKNLWLNLGFDAVNAKIRTSNIPLPRIPPIRGRLGVEYRRGGFSVTPEWVLANHQTEVFSTETPTAGYGTVNVRGAYTWTRQHTLHLFGVNFFNANNAFYRNHLSFIKDTAAEIGRGVSLSYTIRFF